MPSVTGTEKITADNSNIDEILSEALNSSNYKAGFEEGFKEGFEQARAYYAPFIADHRSHVGSWAEVFYKLMLEYVKKEDILQHRIGLDCKTGIPTVLSVISAKAEKKLESLYKLTCKLTHYSYKKEYECQFWVITDHNLDQVSIDHDFPFNRGE